MGSMEATGSNGERWLWSYPGEQTEGSCSSYTISSSSGTIVSTTHTYSGYCPPSSSLSLDPAVMHDLEIHFDEHGSCGKETVTEEHLKHIKNLATEFFGARSAHCSVSGGDGVLERWLTELGVGWVVSMAHAASSFGRAQPIDTQSWIRALSEITNTFQLISTWEEPETEITSWNEATVPDQLQSAQFIQIAMLKMLVFVHVLATDEVPLPPFVKLSTLLVSHSALSEAVLKIRLTVVSVHVETIQGEMVCLLSGKQDKAGRAIWSAMQDYSTHLLGPLEDCSSSISLTPQESSDIHEITHSVMEYINFLEKNSFSVAPIVSEAAKLGKFLPRIPELSPFNAMIMEITSCLHENLVSMSESFPDQGLRFLFWLNNSYFIRQSLKDKPCSIYLDMLRHLLEDTFDDSTNLTHQIEGYMDRYLQVSWAAVLSCLCDLTPLCLFGKNYSRLALSKFESEFQKTYTTQKLWKVHDPELRKRLRTVIIKKIIPVYTQHIVENNVTMPRVAPQELEGMLQELFEG